MSRLASTPQPDLLGEPPPDRPQGRAAPSQEIRATDPLYVLDGWTLTLTCSVCGKAKSRPARDLYASARNGPKTELQAILPLLTCCKVHPKRLVAVCTWARKYQGDGVPVVDVTDLGRDAASRTA